MKRKEKDGRGARLRTRLAAGAAALILLASAGCSLPSPGSPREEAGGPDGAGRETEAPDRPRAGGGRETPRQRAARERAAALERRIREMPLEDRIDRLFFVCPEDLTGAEAVTRADGAVREALERHPVGGIILFSKNIVGGEQLAALTEGLRRSSRYPLFIGVDEEGGPRVARVANSGAAGTEKFPSMREIGAAGDPSGARRVGTVIGGYLKKYGFDVNFAPVADIVSGPDGAVGDRSFGGDPELVSSMVAEEVRGLQSRGVSATLKHFPGHGNAVGDSHDGAAVLDRTPEELRRAEFLPFRAGVEAGADMVMVGHVSVPSVTGDRTPSSLSERMITGFLRNELGFRGVVLSDAMRMGAVTDFCTPGEAAVRFIKAGGDMILAPADFSGARRALLDAVNSGELSPERISESLRRIFRVLEGRAAPEDAGRPAEPRS